MFVAGNQLNTTWPFTCPFAATREVTAPATAPAVIALETPDGAVSAEPLDVA